MTLDAILHFFHPHEALFSDPTINEIRFLPSGVVFVERLGNKLAVEGLVTETQRKFAASHIASSINRELQHGPRDIDVRLQDGSRVAILLPPASPGVAITIRRFPVPFTLPDLVRASSLSKSLASFLVQELLARKNFLISGETKAGKTTLLSALIQEIPIDERLILIEKPTEIRLSEPDTRDALSIEVSDDFDSRHALVASLRHSPDRIILGEVRDSEAYWFLEALNTGHTGSFTTIHANNGPEALRRLARCARAGNVSLPQELVVEDIRNAIQYVVHLAITKPPNAFRYVSEVHAVTGISADGRSVLTTPIPKDDPYETPIPEQETRQTDTQSRPN